MEKLNRPVFVYGILKGQDGARAGIVKNFRLIDMGWFPAAIPASTPQAIKGELIMVNDATIAEFDRIEGAPTFYAREKITVEIDDGDKVDAEMYVITEGYRDRESISTARLAISVTMSGTTYEFCSVG